MKRLGHSIYIYLIGVIPNNFSELNQCTFPTSVCQSSGWHSGQHLVILVFYVLGFLVGMQAFYKVSVCTSMISDENEDPLYLLAVLVYAL